MRSRERAELRRLLREIVTASSHRGPTPGELIDGAAQRGALELAARLYVRAAEIRKERDPAVRVPTHDDALRIVSARHNIASAPDRESSDDPARCRPVPGSAPDATRAIRGYGARRRADSAPTHGYTIGPEGTAHA